MKPSTSRKGGLQVRIMTATLMVVAVIVAEGTPVRAQPIADHLKCYKVKDSQPKAVYSADLGGLVSEPGCQIKVPGTLLCVGATKTNVTPTPPGGVDTAGVAGRFLCYKIKCPKAVLAPVQWHDQFGTRPLTPSTPKIVCAPEIEATTTTTLGCPAPAQICNGACVDTTVDPNNCGTCGTICSAPLYCMSGQCLLIGCPGTEAICNDACVDTTTDPSNCGNCDHVCAPGEACTDSACGACQGATVDCNGTCVDLQSSFANCGACGSACPVGALCTNADCVCPGSTVSCNGTCTDLSQDSANCGTCGNVCAMTELCTGGQCVACPAGTTNCPGVGCTDLSSDFENCGVCGHYCPKDTTTCSASTCE